MVVKHNSKRYRQAADLKMQGLTYREIGKIMRISRQRAQQLCRPPAQIYAMLKKRAGGKCEACEQEIDAGRAHRTKDNGDPWNLDDLLYLCVRCDALAHNMGARDGVEAIREYLGWQRP